MLNRILLFLHRLLRIRRFSRKFHPRRTNQLSLSPPRPKTSWMTSHFLKHLIFGPKPHQDVWYTSAPKYYVPLSPLRPRNSSMSFACGRSVVGGLRGRGLGSGIRRFGDRKLSGVIRSRELGLNSSRRLSGRMRAWSSPALMEDGENGIAGFRRFSEGAWGMSDSRVGDAVGRGKGEDRRIVDDFAEIRDHYATPKYPIVLAHGLLGFSELKLAGNLLPSIAYWRGITEAFLSNHIEVIITSVPPSGSIEERAEKLRQDIVAKAGGKKVNIIAHSMGGLDARYMISKLLGEGRKIGSREGEEGDHVEVVSLTTVATPHLGSAVADYVVGDISFSSFPSNSLNQPECPVHNSSFSSKTASNASAFFSSFDPTNPSGFKAGSLPGQQILYQFLRTLGLSTAAFSQLTRSYMHNKFNPSVTDVPGVRYFSYGATFTPRVWSAFRHPWKVMIRAGEGDNDGLVSVRSSKWGIYKGTVVGVDHLDLINWTNRLRWTVLTGMGKKEKFNAIAFYLGIADMLAKEGL